MDRFRIISQLGAGGFGEAFRAWDTQHSVPVVLKRPLAKHLQRPDVLERFDREINRLRELTHPHIVPIVDHGHDSNGLPYLAMRFLPAGSLADRKKPQPFSFLHRWLPSVAAALDYVHTRGVVHRDVKPANIFFDTESQAYLGDFGIAKVIDEDLARESELSLTSTGGEIGTYPYMGPEFFLKPRILSGTYDQYALAITVYEMICGRRPFSGDSGQLIAAHLTHAPPDLRRLCPDAPPSLCAAVLRALSKKPAERFGTCVDFAEAALRDVSLVSRNESVKSFLCPGCHRLVKVPTGLNGRKCRCPDCSASLHVSEKLDALWLKKEDPSALSVSNDGTSSGSGKGPSTSGSDQSADPTSPEDVWLRRILYSVAGMVVAIIIMFVGLSVRSSARDAKLASAIAQGRWEDALAIEPLNPEALVGRARSKLQADPADIEAAFADLEQASRQAAAGAIVQKARSEAHAARATAEAKAGRLGRADEDLQAAVRGGANQAVLGPTRVAIAGAWLARAEQAAAKGDGPGIKAAADKAVAAGADRVAVTELWRKFVDGRITDMDRRGVELACAESKNAGLSGAPKGWWIRFGRAAAEPPHENAEEVARAADKAVAAGAAAADVSTLRAKAKVLAAAAAQKNGDQKAALVELYQAAQLDPGLVRETLMNPAHASLRLAVVAEHRGRFDEAVGKQDWQQAVQIAAAAKSVDESAANWVNTAVASLTAASIASLPPTVLASLPPAALGSLTPAAAASLSPAALASLPPVALSALTPAAVASIPPAALASLPPDALASLTPAAVASLPRDTILKLSPICNSIGIELKLLPAGTFMMGNKGAYGMKPQQVTLTKPFYIGVYEVTNAEWKRVMGDVPSKWKYESHPVEQVSREDAIEFCEKLSALPEERKAGRVYRLPTEAEWEYACRAGSTSRYSFGDDQSQLNDYAWFDETSGRQTHAVGEKRPNAWGLYDMHGNVAEMCGDGWREYGEDEVTDPQGPANLGGAKRGGSWSDHDGNCTSAVRWGFASRGSTTGFRLALSPPRAQPVPPEAAAGK